MPQTIRQEVETPQQRLRKLIEQRGLSINSVADKSKMDRSSLRRLLRGGQKRLGYLDTWERLAIVLQVEASYLIRGGSVDAVKTR